MSVKMNGTQSKNEAFIARQIRKGRSPQALYDIGVGLKTEWQTLGEIFPQMEICACDPNPAVISNLQQRHFSGKLLQVAIGPEAVPQTLYDTPNNPGNATLLPLSESKPICETEVWTLDHFDDAMGNPAEILLWLDIEGYELTALKSGPRLLASGRVRWINLEEARPGICRGRGWCAAADLQRHLEAYDSVRTAEYNRHATHQDVIYVRRGEVC